MSKRIVVTGASSGIGRELALLLAAEGHSLVLVARRGSELVALADECRTLGAPRVSVVAGSVTDVETAKRAAEALQALGDGVTVLINNAGNVRFGPFHALDIDSAKDQIEVNLVGTMVLTHAVLPAMQAANEGLVVNVVSTSGTMPFPNVAAYSAAKAGVLMFARCLAMEARKYGVRVSSVLPGATDTPIWGPKSPPKEQLMPARAVAETVAWVVAQPADRWLEEVIVRPPQGIP